MDGGGGAPKLMLPPGAADTRSAAVGIQLLPTLPTPILSPVNQIGFIIIVKLFKMVTGVIISYYSYLYK